MRTMKRIAAATAVVSALTITAACGADTSSDSASADTGSRSSSSSGRSSGMSSGMSSDMASDGSSMADPAADLVGPGCAAYATKVPNGSGSVAGMAQDPVAVAAGNNPLLTTLTAAVSGKLNPKVNLVDTLNGGKFTVFAPVDSAFAKLPAATVKSLQTPQGAKALTTVLTYHVVAGRMSPQQIAGKTLTTVEGEKLMVSGSGDHLTAQKAHVICGGVRTANATVYLVDSVLMPPSMG